MSIPLAAAAGDIAPDAFHEISAIVHAITKLAARFEEDLDRAAAEHGITAQQAAGLLSLSRGGQTRMSALSRVLGCDAGNLSGSIDRLEEAGHVVRNVSATDRRVRLLSLTASGRRIASKLERRLGGTRLLSALRGLAPDDLRALGGTLEKLMAANAADARG